MDLERTRPAHDPGATRLAGTFGGPQWRPRARSFPEEVGLGEHWTRCGYRSEVDRLRSVLLVEPPTSIDELADPDAALMHATVDVSRMRGQFQTIRDFFGAHDVNVVTAMSSPDMGPNVVFARDLFAMTPQGAIVARPASQQRAGEERHTAAALADAGIPILTSVRGHGTFEGADALWLDSETVIVGVGSRTNRAGASHVRRIFEECGASVFEFLLGPGVQHLLGAVNFLDRDLAAVHPTGASPLLRHFLETRRITLLDVPVHDRPIPRQPMNFVSIGPRCIAMPAGNQSAAALYRTHGVEVAELETTEYTRAAGGLACLTGILRRD